MDDVKHRKWYEKFVGAMLNFSPHLCNGNLIVQHLGTKSKNKNQISLINTARAKS